LPFLAIAFIVFIKQPIVTVIIGEKREKNNVSDE